MNIKYKIIHVLRLIRVAAGVVLLLSGCRQAPNTAKAPWAAEMDSFAQQDKRTPPPQQGIVFTGSSSVRFWETLADDFPGRPVLNRGFGGSQLADITQHFQELILKYNPRQVVVYSGDNDIAAGLPAEKVFQAFKKLAERMQHDLPNTGLVYIAIKPSPSRLDLYPQMQAVNTKIRTYCQTDPQFRFVEVGAAMLDANGQPRPELYREDGLHMTPDGYALWKQLVEPYLVK